jgi:dTDP-4-dehydrorhamnose reductase
LKVLIFGGGGMLGHKMYQVLSREFETYTTFRDFNNSLRRYNIFDESKIINGVDAFKIETVEKSIDRISPDYVINCIGIIKQLKDSKISKISIFINSLFPHLLSEICEKNKCRLIHFSTDCVFSGKDGNYIEDDEADAIDLYGRTKYLGEINYDHSLTIRTSIIGHELFSNYSMVDWFLSNENGSIKGFSNAIYTGLPTIFLSEEVVRIIKNFPELNKTYQISSNKISKFDLLNIINEVYGLNIKITSFQDFTCDKSLNSKKYISTTNFFVPDWKNLVKGMYQDYLNTNYKGYKNV